MQSTIGDSIGMLSGAKHPKPDQDYLEAVIVAVNYVSKRIQVQAKGHANLRRVRVVDSVNLGTKLAPKVFPRDIAKLMRAHRSGKWECIGIIHKVKCPPHPPSSEAVEVDISYQTSNSDITGNYSSTITPDYTFTPDVGVLGQISLPAQLPFSSTYDVGGGYPGSFTGPIAQNIGLVNGAAWGKYFVQMTGSASWTIVLNGSTIASGSGSGSGTLTSAFAGGSTFQFNITSGSGSDLFFGVGV